MAKQKKEDKIDVYSRFSENNLEFVNENDERDAIAMMRYDHQLEFLNYDERE
jgi:hypothetical protein